ncbi:MAG: thioredoxin-dependent thiol peroxidase [Candidatus Dojkabacteria bacterium]
MVKEGEKINLNFDVRNQNGELVNLASLDSDFLVVYFYPKDNTPGCTKEACSFRDFNEDIKKLGAKVFGVSKDSVKSHVSFSEKHNLNFDLLVDEDLKLHNAFGTFVEKSLFGKKYMGTSRSTFVIKNGEIIRVWEKVKPNDHAKEVYEFLESVVASK